MKNEKWKKLLSYLNNENATLKQDFTENEISAFCEKYKGNMLNKKNGRIIYNDIDDHILAYYIKEDPHFYDAYNLIRESQEKIKSRWLGIFGCSIFVCLLLLFLHCLGFPLILAAIGFVFINVFVFLFYIILWSEVDDNSVYQELLESFKKHYHINEFYQKVLVSSKRVISKSYLKENKSRILNNRVLAYKLAKNNKLSYLDVDNNIDISSEEINFRIKLFEIYISDEKIKMSEYLPKDIKIMVDKLNEIGKKC